ncbi:hypothetical protein Hanom_Chr09g00863381 [Helianthus anomalus]
MRRKSPLQIRLMSSLRITSPGTFSPPDWTPRALGCRLGFTKFMSLDHMMVIFPKNIVSVFHNN